MKKFETSTDAVLWGVEAKCSKYRAYAAVIRDALTHYAASPLLTRYALRAVKFGWLSTRVLPAPSDVLVAGIRLATTGELSRNICISTIRAAIGFLIGGSIGFVLGLLSGLLRVAECVSLTSSICRSAER